MEGGDGGPSPGRGASTWPLDASPQALAAFLTAERVSEGGSFPTVGTRRVIPPFASLIAMGPSLDGCGRGLFARRDLTQGQLVCVVGGVVSARPHRNVYSYSLWENGPVVGDSPIDEDPYTWWAAANQYVWHTPAPSARDFNSLRRLDGGVLVAARKIVKGEELFLHYGDHYDWDEVLWRAAKGLLPHVLEAGAHCGFPDLPAVSACWDQVAGISSIGEARSTSGLPALVAAFITSQLEDYLHSEFPEPRLSAEEWLEILLRCRPFYNQYRFEGARPSSRLPMGQSLLRRPALHSTRLAAQGITYAEADASHGFLGAGSSRLGLHWLGAPEPPEDISCLLPSLNSGEGDMAPRESCGTFASLAEAAELPPELLCLRVISYNCNSLDVAKAEILLQIIFTQLADVTILVDTREPDPGTIAHMKQRLRRRCPTFSVLYTPGNGGSGPRKVGGILMVTTERVFHPEVIHHCPEGSSLTLTASFGGRPIVCHGLYLPNANHEHGSFSARVSAMAGESPEVVIAADIGVAADTALELGALLVVGGISIPRRGSGHGRIGSAWTRYVLITGYYMHRPRLSWSCPLTSKGPGSHILTTSSTMVPMCWAPRAARLRLHSSRMTTNRFWVCTNFRERDLLFDRVGRPSPLISGARITRA